MICVSQNGRFFAEFLPDSTSKIYGWHLNNFKLLKSFSIPARWSYGAGAALSNDGTHLAWFTADKVTCLQTLSGKILEQPFDSTNVCTDMEFSCDGSMIYMAKSGPPRNILIIWQLVQDILIESPHFEHFPHTTSHPIRITAHPCLANRLVLRYSGLPTSFKGITAFTADENLHYRPEFVLSSEHDYASWSQDGKFLACWNDLKVMVYTSFYGLTRTLKEDRIGAACTLELFSKHKARVEDLGSQGQLQIQGCAFTSDTTMLIRAYYFSSGVSSNLWFIWWDFNSDNVTGASQSNLSTKHFCWVVSDKRSQPCVSSSKEVSDVLHEIPSEGRFTTLPAEVLNDVAQHLDIQDRLMVCSSCKALSDFGTSECDYKLLSISRWGPLMPFIKPESQSWRDFYISRVVALRSSVCGCTYRETSDGSLVFITVLVPESFSEGIKLC